MDLFTYLMAKKGHNTHRDLFSYLLGKNAGGSGTYTTFSGTSLNISNTLQAKIKNIALEGNTSQDGTPTPDTPIPIKVVTGEQNITIQNKNLFDKDNIVNNKYISDTGTIISKSGIFYSNFIPINQNKEYVISGKANGWGVTALYDKNKRFIKRVNDTVLNENLEGVYYIRTDGDKKDLETIQIEQNPTATTYVPYQSQTYPLSLGNIELCKIGTYQDYIRKSTGKNLLSSELETGGINTETGQNSSAGRTRTKDYIDIQPNTEYTLSADYQGWYVVYYYNESQTFISSLANNSNKITFTTPSNAKYLRCVVAITNAQNVMLNTGQTALPYEPYGTSWYLNKQIGKVVLDGSETITRSTTSTSEEYRFAINVSNCKLGLDVDLISSHFVNTKLTTYSNRGIGGRTDVSGFFINDSSLCTMTLEEFKSWLSTHNTIVYYVLATPTNTKITDTTLIQQLENINNNARSYKDTTIIECTSASTDNEVIGFSGEIKVTSVGLGNSLNTSLLSSNLQEETNIDDIQEEPNLDDVNEIEDIEQNDEPIENEEIIEEEYQEL